jgi:hypothetical protein
MKYIALITASILISLTFGPGRSIGDEPKKTVFGEMPWHLLDVWWDLGKTTEFESYSIDFNLSDDVPDKSYLYISPLGRGHIGAAGMYGGIQTHSNGHTKADETMLQIGKGVIFSQWDERSLDAIRPSDGGLCQSAGSEGNFVSVRRAYAWKKGLYTYRIVKMDKEIINGKPYTWVGAFVYSHERDENIFVGALRFKGDKLMLEPEVAAFVELYGSKPALADIPRLTVTFNNLRVNGEPAHPVALDVVYPNDVPDYADAVQDGDGVKVVVGQPIMDRKNRHPLLYGQKVHTPRK